MDVRILFVGLHYAPEPSGNAPYTTSLSVGLASRGHSVSVLTGVPHYPEWRVRPGFDRWTSQARESGVDVSRVRHYVPRTPSLARRAAMEVSFGLRAMASMRSRVGGHDVVVCVSPALLASAMVLAGQRRSQAAPALGLWVQDVYSSGVEELHGSSHLGGVVAGVERRTFRTADGIAVAHDRFRRRVVESFGVDQGKVTVIRNWTHVDATAPPTKPSSMRKQLGWGSETVVLHAGNMGVKQGLENVVNAARLADELGSAVRFVLLGGGNQDASLRELGRGIERLQFVRSLEQREFQLALAAADILLVNERPGVAEMSVPSKLTSYYISGRPVLAATASASVTAQEIAVSAAGVQVPPGDPAALLEAALAMGADVDGSRELGRNGRQFAERFLTQEAAVDQFEEWLHALVDTATAKRLP